MKAPYHFIAMIAFAAIVFTSCNKREHQAVTKVINVSLAPNASYSYQIPAAGMDADDALTITQQAIHFSNSTLSITDKNTGGLFQYTPAQDYIGTDEVHISSTEDHNGHGNNGGHTCNGHHDEGTTYVFRITITTGSHPE